MFCLNTALLNDWFIIQTPTWCDIGKSTSHTENDFIKDKQRTNMHFIKLPDDNLLLQVFSVKIMNAFATPHWGETISITG